MSVSPDSLITEWLQHIKGLSEVMNSYKSTLKGNDCVFGSSIEKLDHV